MTSDAQRALLCTTGELLYGRYWQRPLASTLGRHPSLVKWWAGGRRPIPAWVWSRLLALLEADLVKHQGAIQAVREELSIQQSYYDS